MSGAIFIIILLNKDWCVVAYEGNSNFFASLFLLRFFVVILFFIYFILILFYFNIILF